jgi:hypothetical protein
MAYVFSAELYEVDLVVCSKTYLLAAMKCPATDQTRTRIYTCQIKLMELQLIFSIILTRIPMLTAICGSSREQG